MLFRAAPEDFRVDETIPYAPEGEGEHLFVHIRKTCLTTRQAQRTLAEAMGADVRESGYAGMKDRQAVATQWLSFHLAPTKIPSDTAIGALSELTAEGLEILQCVPHRHRLRIGHVQSNRFSIRLPGLAPHHSLLAKGLADLERLGFPNYFGTQRFGRGQGSESNVDRALSWLGGRKERNRFQRKMLASSIQAALFNEVLSQRIGAEQFGTAVAGDLMRKEDSGGLFTDPDTAALQARMDTWEISPTGPMFGSKMRDPESDAFAAEQAVLARWELTPDHLARMGRDGQGTRRPMRVRPQDAALTQEGEDLRIEFTLPSGTYATTLLSELVTLKDADADH